MQGKPKKSTIGLSLGTTDSCVGIWINEQIEILTDNEGCRNIKSYVAFTESGCIVGNEAYNQALQNPQNTIYDIRLLIGKKYHELEALKAQRKWAFEIEPDFNERPLITVTNNKENLKLYPEQIYAMLISKLRQIAEDRLGYPVTDAVISMPATFNNSQREATKHAVTIAGLNPLRLVKEPVAATVGSEIEKIEPDGKEIAVISIGRTKAEVCMLSKLEDTFELVSVYNCPDLSGDILDGILLDHCVEKFQQMTGHSVQHVPQAIKRLKKAVERAKIILSSSLKATIDLDSLHQGEDFTYTLTREKFEELCNPAFEKLTPIFKKSLKACDKALFGDVNVKKIILIGGSTQIPKIAEIVSKFFSGLKLINLKNSGEVIAGGAAVLAAFLGNTGSKRLEQFLIIDATGMPLGIKAAGGKMAQVIRQSHPFPCKVHQIFSTFNDNQLAVTVEVYEGDAEMVHENHFVGKFILNGISPALKGVPQIKVTFRLDNFGILSVEAQEETGAQNKIEAVFEKGGFAPAEIQQLMNKNQEIFIYKSSIIED